MIDKLLNQVKSLRFKKATKSTWDRMKWEGIPEEFDRKRRGQWEESDLEIPSGLEKDLQKLDDDAVDTVNEFDDKLKKKYGYIDLVDYQDGEILIIRPKDGEYLFESDLLEQINVLLEADRKCPLLSGHPYAGIRASGGYGSWTNLEVGLSRIAEALHCILGSLVRDMSRGGSVTEVAHIEEEIGVIEKAMRRYGDKSVVEQLKGGHYDEETVEKSLSNIKENSERLLKKVSEKQDNLHDDKDGVPPEIFKLADFTYEALKALARGAKGFANSNLSMYRHPFQNQALIDEIKWIKRAFREYKRLEESTKLVEAVSKLVESEYLTEMFVHGNKRDYDGLAAYRKDLWVFDVDQIPRKVAKSIKRELGLRYAPDNLWDLRDALDGREDVLLGQIERGRELDLISTGSFNFDPESSVLVKKVVKELGLNRVSRYGYDEVEHSRSKHSIKGRIPKYMYHGTSTDNLQGILKKGIRAGEAGSNYTDQDIEHRDIVFFTTHKDKALYHANNAANQTGGLPVIIEVEIPDKDKLIPDYDIDVDADDKYYDHIDPFTKRKAQKHSKGIGGSSESMSRELGVYGYTGNVLPQKIEAIYIPTDESATGPMPDGKEFMAVDRKKALVWLDMIFSFGAEAALRMTSHESIEQRMEEIELLKFGEPWVTSDLLDPYGANGEAYVEYGTLNLDQVEYDRGEEFIMSEIDSVKFWRCRFEDAWFIDDNKDAVFKGCKFRDCTFEIPATKDEIEGTPIDELPLLNRMEGCEFDGCRMLSAIEGSNYYDFTDITM